MAIALRELETLIETLPEGENLEFKEAKNAYDAAKLFRYCVALANEGGGKFILGVTDKPPRRVVGTHAFPDTQDIATRIFGKLNFRVDVEEVIHADGRILIFNIPSRPRGTAYQCEGAYLMRSGEDLVAMTEDRLRRIFDEGKPDWLSQAARSDCLPGDVIALLSTESYFDLLGIPYPTQRDEVLKRLIREGLVQRQGNLYTITNLGAVLFAKRLEDFEGLSLRAPRVVVYEGTGKQHTKLHQLGTKGYAVGFEGLLEFIHGLSPQNDVIGKALRTSVKMFPEEAVRELVANALIHQDFNVTGSSVMIDMYTDRIEIRNPGTPPIPPDRFIDEAQSRNERLADLMRRLGICERQGSGIDKVIVAVEAWQLPAPSFRVGDLSMTVILFAQKSFPEMIGSDRIRACYQHCVLRWVMNADMTNQTLRERFGLSEGKTATISQIIASTVEAGLIKPVDSALASKRYARYIPAWA